MTGIFRDPLLRLRDRLRLPDFGIRLSGPCRDAPWANLGPPFPGVIRDVAIDPSDRRRLYVASANGGVWRLNNVDDYPNTVWEPLTDGLANLRFRRLAVSPSNPDVLYAASADKDLRGIRKVYSKLWRSGDRGRSWQSIEAPNMGVVHRLVVKSDVDEVLAATSTGLWQRNTTTRQWRQLYSGDCLDVAADPDDQDVLYLGVRLLGVFVSTNGAAAGHRSRSWPTTRRARRTARSSRSRWGVVSPRPRTRRCLRAPRWRRLRDRGRLPFVLATN